MPCPSTVVAGDYGWHMKTCASVCLLAVAALVVGCTPTADVRLTPAPTPSPSASPSPGRASLQPVVFPGTASFVHGHTTRWTYETDSIKFVLPGDTTWVVVTDAPDDPTPSPSPDASPNSATVFVGLDAATGKQVWREQLDGYADCAADLLVGNVACVMDQPQGDEDPWISKLTLIDPYDGSVVQSIDLQTLFPTYPADARRYSTRGDLGGARPLVVDDTLIVTVSTDYDSDARVAWAMTSRVSTSLAPIWTTDAYPIGSTGTAWTSTVRAKAGILVYSFYDFQVAFNLTTGAILQNGDVSDIVGADTLVSTSPGTYPLPNGGTRKFFELPTVWFPAPSDTPPYPIAYLPIPTPQGVTAIGAIDPATGKTPWKINLTAKQNPGAVGTFSGAYRDGTLVLVDSDGQVYRVDPKSGKTLWHSHYTGYGDRFREDGGIAPVPTILWDGTVLVYDEGMDGDMLVAFDPNTGKQVWTMSGTIPRWLPQSPGGPNMCLTPFGPSLAVITPGAVGDQVLSCLDPITP